MWSNGRVDVDGIRWTRGCVRASMCVRAYNMRSKTMVIDDKINTAIWTVVPAEGGYHLAIFWLLCKCTNSRAHNYFHNSSAQAAQSKHEGYDLDESIGKISLNELRICKLIIQIAEFMCKSSPQARRERERVRICWPNKFILFRLLIPVHWIHVYLSARSSRPTNFTISHSVVLLGAEWVLFVYSRHIYS